jgi:hypothetical protein
MTPRRISAAAGTHHSCGETSARLRAAGAAPPAGKAGVAHGRDHEHDLPGSSGHGRARRHSAPGACPRRGQRDEHENRVRRSAGARTGGSGGRLHGQRWGESRWAVPQTNVGERRGDEPVTTLLMVGEDGERTRLALSSAVSGVGRAVASIPPTPRAVAARAPPDRGVQRTGRVGRSRRLSSSVNAP